MNKQRIVGLVIFIIIFVPFMIFIENPDVFKSKVSSVSDSVIGNKLATNFQEHITIVTDEIYGEMKTELNEMPSGMEKDKYKKFFNDLDKNYLLECTKDISKIGPFRIYGNKSDELSATGYKGRGSGFERYNQWGDAKDVYEYTKKYSWEELDIPSQNKYFWISSGIKNIYMACIRGLRPNNPLIEPYEY